MNIYEIAERANVSAATVSRVINRKPNISAATYARVMRVLDETGYSPNAIARGLTTNSMNLVGIMVDDIRNLYRANVIYYLEDFLSRKGYNSVVFNVGTKGDMLTSLILQQPFDALIFVGSSMGCEWVHKFVQTHFPQKPVLMFNGELGLPNAISVICDEYKGMQFIGDHLYRTGRRKPVYVNFGNNLASQRKYHGFREKMDALLVPFGDERVFYSETEGFEGGCEVARRIIESGIGFDAVACCLDLIALGVMHTLKHYGFSIPGDIAVTGFDNLIYGKLSAPFLTSIDGKIEEMSERAIDLLVEGMNEPGVKREPVYVTPSLFLGGTT